MNFDFNYYEPVRVLFGQGKIIELGENAKSYGKKALIVTTGNFFYQTGLINKLQNILRESGMDSKVFADVSPNPLCTQVDNGAKFGREKNCDVIIGLGGGSSIDAAKGIAVAIGHNEKIWNFCPGTQENVLTPTSNTLPIITITTTSGTGSHVTSFSVITNPETKEKPGMGSEYIFPKAAIVDPQLMVTMPPAITAATGFDVLAHVIEAYTSNISTPITDLYCEEAMRLVGRYLRVAVKNGNNIEARSAMALADTYAGFAISIAVITLCHSISHVVGGICGTVHGETLAALTPQTLRFSMHKDPVKFRDIGLFLRNECKEDKKGRISDDDLENTVKEVEKIIKDINMDIPLRKQGVKESDIDAIAEGTVGYMAIGVEKDLRKATKEDVVEILKKSF
ncbi:MAG: iron-containing alcohol dehydrogenase [Actinobacteria bacterium]|nr:iron-containing alcohol dehydrogenase [Actinomycetota bacterium]